MWGDVGGWGVSGIIVLVLNRLFIDDLPTAAACAPDAEGCHYN